MHRRVVTLRNLNATAISLRTCFDVLTVTYMIAPFKVYPSILLSLAVSTVSGRPNLPLHSFIFNGVSNTLVSRIVHISVVSQMRVDPDVDKNAL